MVNVVDKNLVLCMMCHMGDILLTYCAIEYAYEYGVPARCIHHRYYSYDVYCMTAP